MFCRLFCPPNIFYFRKRRPHLVRCKCFRLVLGYFNHGGGIGRGSFQHTKNQLVFVVLNEMASDLKVTAVVIPSSKTHTSAHTHTHTSFKTTCPHGCRWSPNTQRFTDWAHKEITDECATIVESKNNLNQRHFGGTVNVFFEAFGTFTFSKIATEHLV